MPDGAAFPARDLAIFLAAGVILCWLAIAALALPRVARGLVTTGHEAAQSELRRARIGAAEAAIARLENITSDQAADGSLITIRQAVAEGLIASYRRRIAALAEGESISNEIVASEAAESELRLAAVQAERDALRGMLRKGDINDHTLHQIIRELTLSEALIAVRKTD